MAVSGAILKEVGTTNITRLEDYEQAIGPSAAAILRIHPSNYRIRGFTESVPLADMVALAKKHGILVIDDIGSGALLDLGRFGFEGEPIARDSIAAGADLVLFSGDKLLGGPQAGILAGKKGYIEKIESDPLMRAFRCDKMTLAALEATLRLYLNEELALRQVPVLLMLTTPLAKLHKRAHALAQWLHPIEGLASVNVAEDQTYAGGGLAARSGHENLCHRIASQGDQRRRIRPAAEGGHTRGHGTAARGQGDSGYANRVRTAGG